MTLDLRDELESATATMLPSGDLVARAQAVGRRRLLIHRLGNAAAGVTAAAVLAVGVTSFDQEWWQAPPDSRPGATAAEPADADAVTGLDGSPSAAMTNAAWRAEAQQRCHAALAQQLSGAQLLFVSPSTVEAVRNYRDPSVTAALATEPWAGLADADTVGWCTLKSGGTYKIIAAAARGASITFVTSDQPLDDPGPHGPAIS